MIYFGRKNSFLYCCDLLLLPLLLRLQWIQQVRQLHPTTVLHHLRLQGLEGGGLRPMLWTRENDGWDLQSWTNQVALSLLFLFASVYLLLFFQTVHRFYALSGKKEEGYMMCIENCSFFWWTCVGVCMHYFVYELYFLKDVCWCLHALLCVWTMMYDMNRCI